MAAGKESGGFRPGGGMVDAFVIILGRLADVQEKAQTKFCAFESRPGHMVGRFSVDQPHHSKIQRTDDSREQSPADYGGRWQGAGVRNLA